MTSGSPSEINALTGYTEEGILLNDRVLVLSQILGGTEADPLCADRVLREHAALIMRMVTRDAQPTVIRCQRTNPKLKCSYIVN